MRVASANLQHGVPDPVGRPPSRGPSRLCAAWPPTSGRFQELDHRRWRTRFADQGQQLADALDGELVWALAKRVFLGGQANALVVRGEVVEREVVELAGEGERRVLVLAVVVVDGERWTVGTTHLALRPAVGARAAPRGAAPPDHPPGPLGAGRRPQPRAARRRTDRRGARLRPARTARSPTPPAARRPAASTTSSRRACTVDGERRARSSR